MTEVTDLHHLPSVVTGLRRRADPLQLLLAPGLELRLQERLEGAPWDVFTTAEVATALADDLSPLALNDWRYKRLAHAPPAESRQQYKGNVVRYRKDRLIGWRLTGGRSVPAREIWHLSADYLQALGFARPETLAETEDLIRFCLDRRLLTLRARPRRPFQAFPDDSQQTLNC